jgi:glycosyltransferase involved in cell wall biosynthesis
VKVLVISGAFPPKQFAEANHAYFLCRRLAEHGIDVELLTATGAVTDGLPFKVHPVMEEWSWGEVPRVSRLLKRSAPDAVLMVYIGFLYNDHPMATFLPSICNAALPGVPFVTQFENVMGSHPERWPLPTQLVRKALKSWFGTEDVDYEFGTLLRDSHRVIALSPPHLARLAAQYPAGAERCVLVPAPPIMNVCDDAGGSTRQAGRARLGARLDDFVLTYYGYIYESKGLETLIRALHLARDRGCKARLVIAGGIPAHLRAERLAYLKQLEGLAKSLGIADNVTWTGECPWDGDEASHYLYAADACILPFDDGVSMNNSTFAAAAAHGRPIIATRSTVAEPVFHHRQNVFLCRPRDPEDLADAITTVAGDVELRGRLAAGAAQIGEEWFSWTKVVERTLATLERDGRGAE